MRTQTVMLHARLLALIILANFVAQVPYFFHLYYRRQALLISVRSLLIMAPLFAFFLIAAWRLFQHQRFGYPMLFAFLAAEFLFYLLSTVASALRGNGLFFQVHNPDVVLRIIYSIGYLNLFASGYFLYLLVRHRAVFEPAD